MEAASSKSKLKHLLLAIKIKRRVKQKFKVIGGLNKNKGKAGNSNIRFERRSF
jgi:hypothetical protein